MQTNDPDYLFQTTSELSNAERRERKLKAAEKVGDPIKVSSKVSDLSVDDQLAWTAESGWQARKINLATGKTTMLYKGHKGPVTSVQLFKVAGETPWLALITSSWDKTVKIWDAATGECKFTLQGHQDFVKSVTVLPTSPPTLLSTSSDKSCRLWDLSTSSSNEEPTTIQTIKDHTRPVDSAAYWIPEAGAQDNIIVWTSDSLGVIKRWNLIKAVGSTQTPMKFVEDLNTHDTSVGQLYPTEDGIWSVSMDKTARFHGDPSVVLKHPSYVKSLLPQPFGSPYILTGAEDEEVRIWDAANSQATKNQPISIVSGHCGEVTAIVPWLKAENGKSIPHVVTAGLDGTVRRWTIQESLHPPKLDYEPASQDSVASTEEEERELAESLSDDD